MNAIEHFNEVQNRIIELMETTGIDWVKPWSASGAPINAVTGRNYHGINFLQLGLVAFDQNWPNEWAGFQQWRKIGCNVRKGEHGTKVLVMRQYKSDEGDGPARVFASTKTVFNAEQVEGWAPSYPLKDFTPIEEAEQFILEQHADIRWGGSRACYIPSLDRIQLPEPESFTTPASYYGTAFHELVHWTGATERLARTFGTFGDPEYAFEELVAEMGSAMLSGYLGVSTVPREDHAKYLNNWVRFLSDHDGAIHRASIFAKQACSFLLKEDAA